MGLRTPMNKFGVQRCRKSDDVFGRAATLLTTFHNMCLQVVMKLDEDYIVCFIHSEDCLNGERGLHYSQIFKLGLVK